MGSPQQLNVVRGHPQEVSVILDQWDEVLVAFQGLLQKHLVLEMRQTNLKQQIDETFYNVNLVENVLISVTKRCEYLPSANEVAER